MTMPQERTLSVLNTLKFLHELSHRQDLPEDVRLTAEGLARHFPTAVDIKAVAQIMARGSNPLREEIFCVDDIDGSGLGWFGIVGGSEKAPTA